MECTHPGPESFGASEVSWNSAGIGTVILPCRDCGEYRVWTIEGEK